MVFHPFLLLYRMVFGLFKAVFATNLFVQCLSEFQVSFIDLDGFWTHFRALRSFRRSSKELEWSYVEIDRCRASILTHAHSSDHKSSFVRRIGAIPTELETRLRER